MKELKFVRVLSQLSKNELNKLQRFLESPYFNVNPKVLGLFKSVVEDGNLDDPARVNKNRIWKKLMPEQAFHDPRWRKWCNELMGLIEKFLVCEQLAKKPLLENNLLLESVYENKLTLLYKSILSKAENDLNKNKNPSSDFHLQHFLFQRNLYDLKEYEINMESQSNLETIHEVLDLFYLAEKTKQLVNAVTRRIDFNLPIRIDLEDQLIQIVRQGAYLEHPEIGLYYKIYQLYFYIQHSLEQYISHKV